MFIQEKQAIEIKKLLTLATGQDCSDISNKKMLNILEKRLKELKFNDFNNYLKYLNQNSLKEISQLKENVDIEKYAFFEFKFHHDKISKEISGNNVSNKLPKELNILSIESSPSTTLHFITSDNGKSGISSSLILRTIALELINAT